MIKQINQQPNTECIEVSEASAELVRTGAQISLEDMESENFSIISGSFNTDTSILPLPTEISILKVLNDTPIYQKCDEMLRSDIDLIDTIPIEDKNLPSSPSEIFKNLSLSKEDDFTSQEERKVDIFDEFNIYL